MINQLKTWSLGGTWCLKTVSCLLLPVIVGCLKTVSCLQLPATANHGLVPEDVLMPVTANHGLVPQDGSPTKPLQPRPTGDFFFVQSAAGESRPTCPGPRLLRTQVDAGPQQADKEHGL